MKFNTSKINRCPHKSGIIPSSNNLFVINNISCLYLNKILFHEWSRIWLYWNFDDAMFLSFILFEIVNCVKERLAIERLCYYLYDRYNDVKRMFAESYKQSLKIHSQTVYTGKRNGYNYSKCVFKYHQATYHWYLLYSFLFDELESNFRVITPMWLNMWADEKLQKQATYDWYSITIDE